MSRILVGFVLATPLAKHLAADTSHDVTVTRQPHRRRPAAVFIGGMLYLLRKVLEGARPAAAVESMVQFILSGLGVDHEEAEHIVRIDLNTYGIQPA